MNVAEAEELLAAAGFHGAALTLLAGDASTRRYHRARTPEGRTAIIMQAGSPLPAQGAGGAETFPFLRWRAVYAELGIRVPRLLAQDRGRGLLLLEDLGDELLECRVAARGAQACRELYLAALDAVLVLARRGTAAYRPADPAADDPLVPRRLAWEMDFFLANALGLPQESLAGQAGAVLEARSLLHRLCDDVHAPAGEAGMVLCHRDHHARNLLVVAAPDGGEEPALIDFQDTRPGPRAYDVASLAFDPYVELPAALVDELILRARPDGPSERDWRAEVDLAAAQRLVKAAGSYAFLARERGRREYLRWYRPALTRAQARLVGWPGAGALVRALTELRLLEDQPPT